MTEQRSSPRLSARITRMDRAALIAVAAELFAGERGLRPLLQRKRPYICPFDRLIELVPDEEPNCVPS